MAADLTLAARLALDARRWEEGVRRGESSTRRFVGVVKREFDSLRDFARSTEGMLASIGAGYAVGAQLVRSARMDKTLTQVGQTAGVTKAEVRTLREEIFRLGKDTGRPIEDLQSGFSTLIASGQQWGEARITLRDINKTMVVTGAQAETLAGALGVASTAFDFDLSKPGQALAILDRMTVAGRKGNAELENLGSIFSRIGPNARGAGFGFDQTLAFIEGLSMIERQPERLATLADSTLRLFTNAKYMKDAQKATGIRFFDQASGARRDPLQILADLKKRMDTMTTDAQREGFLSKAFGNADLDTIKGLRTLLTGNALTKINDFTSEIGGATGTIERDLPAALNNAVDQAGRLKTTLIEGADAFAQRINGPFASITKRLLDKKEDGGMELGARGLLAGGAAGLMGLFAGKRIAGRMGSALLGRMFGGAASLGTGVAMGTALEKAGAATPVFIVGAAPGLFAGGGVAGGVAGAAGSAVAGAAARRIGTAALLGRGALALGGTGVGALAGAGVAGVGALAAGVGAAGVAGYGIGTGIYKLAIEGTALSDAIGKAVAIAISPFSKEARETLKLDVNIKAANGLVVSGRPDFSNVSDGPVRATVRTGRMLDRPGRE